MRQRADAKASREVVGILTEAVEGLYSIVADVLETLYHSLTVNSVHSGVR